MAYIERAITSVLKNRVSSGKCLLLTGARQVGKSTIIKHVFPEYNRADFDDRMTRLQVREEPKLFFMNHPRPLFIDEVQKLISCFIKIQQQSVYSMFDEGSEADYLLYRTSVPGLDMDSR